MITIKQLEKAYGAPVEEWVGNCYGLACAAAKLIKGAVPIYGHYLGKVAKGTFFDPVSVGGFVQHGWVQLKGGNILDPTRWAFEGVEPYLYVGPYDVYDEGGNAVRMALMGRPPKFEPDDAIINVTPEMLNSDAWVFVEKLFDLEQNFANAGYEPGDITRTQLAWLANYDPHQMRGHATAIYTLLKELGYIAFIPLDNREMVERNPM